MTGPPPKNISFDDDEKDQIYHPEFVTNADMGEVVITSEGYLRDPCKVGSLMDDFDDPLKAYRRRLEQFINSGWKAPTVEEVGEAWAKLDLILRLPLADASTRSAEAKEAARLILMSPTTTDGQMMDLLYFEDELENLIANHVTLSKLQAASSAELTKKSRLMDVIRIDASFIQAKIKEQKSLLRKKQRLDEKIANLQADRDAIVVASEQSKKRGRDSIVVALEQSKKRGRIIAHLCNSSDHNLKRSG